MCVRGNTVIHNKDRIGNDFMKGLSKNTHTHTYRKRPSYPMRVLHFLAAVYFFSFFSLSFPPCKLLSWIFVNSFHWRHLIPVLASWSQIFLHKRPLKRDLYFQSAHRSGVECAVTDFRIISVYSREQCFVSA